MASEAKADGTNALPTPLFPNPKGSRFGRLPSLSVPFRQLGASSTSEGWISPKRWCSARPVGRKMGQMAHGQENAKSGSL